MIRINLLPVKAAQKKVQLRNQLIIVGITLSLVVGACIVANSSIQSDIAAVKQDISHNQREIGKLKKKIGEVNKFKKLQAELKNKLQVLASLKAAKSGPVHLMDDLIKVLPAKLWITDFKEKGGRITLKGVGLSEDDVAEFMTNLEKSSFYQGVVLKVTKQKVANGLKLQNFDLTCQIEKQKSVPVADK